jgi:hypothetical protein
MQFPIFCQAFDGGNGRAIQGYCERRAGLQRNPVHVDGTAAALARVATDMCPGQAQVHTQEFDQQRPWLDVGADALSIDGHGNGGHQRCSTVPGL